MKFIAWSLAAILGLGAVDFAIWTWPWTFNVAVQQIEGRRSLTEAIPLRMPLARIVGNYVPLPRMGMACGSDFSGSVALAEKLESYALLVWHQGRIVLEHYGSNSISESRPNSASMHKTVLALLIGSALGDGSLKSISAPLGDYIDDWKGDPRGRITLRQALQMTSGLAPFSPEGGLFSEYERFVLGLWPETLMLRQPLVKPPGTEFHYLNINSQLAGMALQKAVGVHYSEYLSEKLWRPLGAKDAYVWTYAGGDHMPRAYSSLFARAEDWLRIGIMLKDQGRFMGRQVVPEDWIATMLEPSPRNPNYGLHIWRASPYTAKRWYDTATSARPVMTGAPWLDPSIFFLDGAGGNRVYISRAEDVVIVRTGMSFDGWQDSALPNMIISELRRNASAPELDTVGRPGINSLFVKVAAQPKPRCVRNIPM